MKLKNSTILALVQLGIQGTTEHDVPVKDAYKAYAFRHAIEKANKDLDEKRQGLVKSAGIEKPDEFDKRMKELREMKSRTKEQEAEMSEMTEKLSKFNELYKELLEDETELEGVKVMSYESYHALAKENRGKEGKPDIFSLMAGELEGILWKAPEGEE